VRQTAPSAVLAADRTPRQACRRNGLPGSLRRRGSPWRRRGWAPRHA